MVRAERARTVLHAEGPGFPWCLAIVCVALVVTLAYCSAAKGPSAAPTGVPVESGGGGKAPTADTSCNTDFKSVEVAQEAYFAKRGAYGSSIKVLVADEFLRSAPSNEHYAIATDSTGNVYVASSPNPIPNPVPAAVATQTASDFCP